ncbi:unnamed protein product [Diatraea saccharalis]|uniref:Peptidase S1 domain-containing protein n=1 Tax=Diatraea saccharalis TaxID=40085 RepID=A0A9N9QY02_9NEOP|nr:unnamed protein product [Diatraea saccharalis]
MKVILLLLFLSIYTQVHHANTEEYLESWHESVGIKNAKKIKEYEDILYQRIVGGAIAPLNAHPYLVGLLIDLWGSPSLSACGGSLLTSNRILTAAHCWYDGRFQAMRFTAVLGSPFLFHGGLRITPDRISVHSQYNSRTFANDIAMLFTPIRIAYTHNIQPISLPHGEMLNESFEGEWTLASGYGRYSDIINPSTNTMARHVSLKVIPLAHCRVFYGNIVLDSNICTNGYGGVGICQGDSGGPLIVNRGGQPILIGVSSFVALDGCELGFPSAFARVSTYINWIRQLL